MNLIITGKPRSGKTTVCMKLREMAISHGMSCGGVLCPEVNSEGARIGCDVENLITGKREVISRLKESADFEGIEIGHYVVSPKGLEFGRKALENSQSCELIFIDEIGGIEMRDMGLMDVARKLLLSDKSKNLVVIVTSRLLDKFLRRFPNLDFDIFEVDEGTRGELPVEIFKRITENDVQE